MPMYEYLCTKCDVRFEEYETLEEKGKAIDNPCPNCCTIGHIKPVISAPRINTYGVWNSQKKLPEDFKRRMQQIKREHPNGFKNSQFI